jgi:hypothetical protein
MGQFRERSSNAVLSTVKRYFYETHDELRAHLRDFADAYNFAGRLKTLKGLTPMSSSAKPGLHSRKDSQSVHSRKCRD